MVEFFDVFVKNLLDVFVEELLNVFDFTVSLYA